MHTIWSKTAIPVDEWKYRNLKRVLLPTVDIFFAIGGFLGASHGIPAVDQVYGPTVSMIGGYAFTVVALVCFIGVAFPRLWLLEVYGKCALLGMIVGYMGVLVAGAFITHTSSAYVLSLAGVCLAFVIWRLSILVDEARARGGK